MSKDILLLTGTYPPEKCGVADYSYNLLQAAPANTWELYHDTNWSLFSFFKKVKEVAKSDKKWINIQYPSVGFGYSLVPHFMCVYFSLFSRKRVSVTLHEYSRLGSKSRFATLMFLIFAQKLIFTNEFERAEASKRFSPVKKKSKVIRIYSNIKAAAEIQEIQKRKLDVGYFGILSPKKGLEEFLVTARQLKQINPEYEIYIMGQTLAEYESYHTAIIAEANEIGVKLFLNETDSFVTQTLADTKVCNLPFPDGVSERRGSFLAAVVNRCLIFTTKGSYTTAAHESFCFFSNENDTAAEIDKVLRKDAGFFAERQEKIKYFIENEVPKSWDDVAVQYNDFLG